MSSVFGARVQVQPLRGFAPCARGYPDRQERVDGSIQLELFDPDEDGLDFGQWMESLPLDPLGDE
jgi:hypothetical protein